MLKSFHFTTCLTVLTVILLFLCPHKEADAELPPLPRLQKEYCDSFQWDGDSHLQDIKFTFPDPFNTQGNTLLASGTGIYNAQISPVYTRGTRIDIEAKVSLTNGAIEILESNPNASGFITDGKHIGYLSADGMKINARWHNHSNKGIGTLLLESCDKDLTS